jgi:prepilin-type N-terminal cleavage/methylation domain-containing protein
MLRSACGFTLIEVLVALGIVVGGVTALAPLASMTVRANTLARTMTTTAILAQQKMEELLPEVGVDLDRSPAGALARNLDGWFDFVDRSGHVLGGGAPPPAGADYLRRWSVEPLADSAGHLLVVQVLVTDVRNTASADAAGSPRADRVRILSARALEAF